MTPQEVNTATNTLESYLQQLQSPINDLLEWEQHISPETFQDRIKRLEILLRLVQIMNNTGIAINDFMYLIGSALELIRGQCSPQTVDYAQRVEDRFRHCSLVIDALEQIVTINSLGTTQF